VAFRDQRRGRRDAVSIEAAVLGLLSAFRATPLAVVYGFLLTRSPRRLLAAYLVAGMVVSLGVGIGAVLWFGASASAPASTTGRDVVDLVLGVGALSYAAGFAAGRLPREPREDRPRRGGALLDRLREPSLPVAALAGALTNLPGLFYLAGLVAILETRPGPVNAVVQVVVYNVLRFATPAAALALVVVSPSRVRALSDGLFAWAARHRRWLVLGLFGAAGAYLVVKGLTGLLG
jgi:hypothetical protein